MKILLVAQSIAIPLFLSYALANIRPSQKYFAVFGFVLIWASLFVWITGFPEIMPTQAIDWLLLLVILLLATVIIESRKFRLITISSLMVTSIILYSLPLLKYELNIQLLLEMVMFGLAAVVSYILLEYRKPVAASLTVSISSGFMAIGTLLGGSMLIAQLSSVLTFTLAGFALHDIRRTDGSALRSHDIMIIAIAIYYSLLMIGHFFSEFPLQMTVMLLVAPITGFMIRGVFGWISNLSLSIAAVVSIYDEAAVSGY